MAELRLDLKKEGKCLKVTGQLQGYDPLKGHTVKVEMKKPCGTEIVMGSSKTDDVGNIGSYEESPLTAGIYVVVATVVTSSGETLASKRQTEVVAQTGVYRWNQKVTCIAATLSICAFLIGWLCIGLFPWQPLGETLGHAPSKEPPPPLPYATPDFTESPVTFSDVKEDAKKYIKKTVPELIRGVKKLYKSVEDEISR